MVAIWSPENKIVAERRLWLAVLRAQSGLGLDGRTAGGRRLRGCHRPGRPRLDPARERITRHDVKARIEEFNALAGHEQIHKGMTSRDLTENVEQAQIRRRQAGPRRTVSLLAHLGRRAAEYAELVMAGRTHNVPAQATTLGKRFASAADEMLLAYQRISSLLERYPLRGIKGPVGTGQDMLDLLGSPEALDQLGNGSRRRGRRSRHVGADQRRPGLSPIPRLRGGVGAGPIGGRPPRWPPPSG